MPLATYSLVLGLRGDAMMIRPGWDRALSGPAVRPAAMITLPMELGIEAGLAWSSSPEPYTERYVASFLMYWPITPEWRHLRPTATYGWEYSGLVVDDGVRRALGTVYGVGGTWQVVPHVGLRPGLMIRSDSHVDGGSCLLSPRCVAASLFAGGRYNAMAQIDAVLSF